MKICTNRLTILALLTCLANTPAAYAATATTTFNVTATVPTSCSVSAGGDLAFGSYIGTELDATTTVSITCTNGGAYTVGLDNGLHPLSTQRRISNGTNYLNYELYSDSGMTAPWGNVSGSWVSGTGTGSAQVDTVYGKLDSGQALNVGTYTDTVTVTVTYTP